MAADSPYNSLEKIITIGQKQKFFPLTEQEADHELNQFQSNAARIRDVYGKLVEKDVLPRIFKVQKNEVLAEAALQEGNRKARNSYMAALESYNEALCQAPQGSAVLGRAYANRSAIFQVAGFYSFALENIELALVNNYPEERKSRLIERKQKLLEKQESNQDSYDIYSSIEEVQLSHAKHPKIPFVVDAVDYDVDEYIGRHIIAKRDLKPGDILVLEDPFTTAPFRGSVYICCYNCTAHNFYNLIPCPNSIRAMFCSKRCIEEALKYYYRYECPIIDGILDLVENNFAVRATFKALMLFQDRTEFKQLLVQGEENPFEQDFRQIDEITKIIKFRIFNSMSTNEDRKPRLDVIKIVYSCAVVYHMIQKRCTELQEEFSNDHELEDVFLELLMRYHQIEEINNFDVIEPFTRIGAPVMHFSSGGMAQGNYILSFLFGHSCAPNACFFSANSRGRLGIVTLHPIKAGEKIYITYGPFFLKSERATRQEKLKARFQFDCRCVACEDVQTFSKNTDLKTKLPPKLAKDVFKISSNECLFDDEARACAIRVIKDMSTFISTHFDKLYPSLDIHACEICLLDAISIRVFRTPMDVIFRHPPPLSPPNSPPTTCCCL